MKKTSVLIAVVVILFGGALVYWFRSAPDKIVIVPDSLGKMNDIDLKPGQQVVVKTEKGEMDVQKLAQTHLTEVMDGYFKLPEGAARTKYLDEMIDQQEAAKKQVAMMDAPTIASATQPTTHPSGASPTTQPMRASIRMKAGPGAEQNLPPALRGQIAEFVSALAKRRAERGLPPSPGMMIVRQETVTK